MSNGRRRILMWDCHSARAILSLRGKKRTPFLWLETAENSSHSREDQDAPRQRKVKQVATHTETHYSTSPPPLPSPPSFLHQHKGPCRVASAKVLRTTPQNPEQDLGSREAGTVDTQVQVVPGKAKDKSENLLRFPPILSLLPRLHHYLRRLKSAVDLSSIQWSQDAHHLIQGCSPSNREGCTCG